MNFQYPVPPGSPVTQTFAQHRRNNPGYNGGIDWAVVNGTPVKAAQAGVVTVARLDNTGYGQHIRIQHSDNFLTVYGHLKSYSVSVGVEVHAGQVIGLSDNTGNSTGPHLHFEVRQNGTPIDPAPLLVETVPEPPKTPVACPFGGVSVFVWKVAACAPDKPWLPTAWEHIATKLEAVGVKTVYVKVADGTGRYNLCERTPGNWTDEVMPGFCAHLKARGFTVIGWQYVYGADPVGEARVALARIAELHLDGYAIDAEGEYKKAGMATNARAYMRTLRGGSNVPLGLCSYRFPTLHPQLPWSTFLSYMDVEHGDAHVPQVYWELDSTDDGPARQLRRSITELRALEALPVIPVFPMYRKALKDGYWYSTYRQLKGALEEVIQTEGVPGMSIWSLDKVNSLDGRGPESAEGSPYRYWDFLAYASGKWGDGEEPPVTPPPPDVPLERKVALLWREAGKRGWDLSE